MSYEFDPKLGRRRFLKLGGGAAVGIAGAAAISGLGTRTGEHAIDANAAGKAKWGREAGTWTPSCCNMCGGQSGVLVHVVDGIVEKVEPNHWNPNNYSNISSDFFDGYTEEYGCKEGGALCPKGNAGIVQLYDADRVQKPLRRGNPDKSIGADPKWQEISWDQALNDIAAKLKALQDADEANKLLWFSEDASFTAIQNDFCTLYGSPNYSNHSNLCDVARKASFKTVMGHDRPLADFIESKYIMLFGWNPTSAIKWVHLPRIITRAIERGARMVVIDPYLSDTAAKAHEWVPLRPGTDGALALAMANVIIRDKLYDQAFVTNWTVGFDKYSDYVKDKTPKWAEEITSVKAATIERLAKELSTTKPALVDAWSGPGQHSNGVQGGRAIALLNALIGGWDRPGGMMIPDRSGNKHTTPTANDKAAASIKRGRFDELEKYPMGHSSGVYARAFTNLLDGKGPYQPKVGVVVFQNVLMSVPGTDNVAKALAKLEMLVVVDTMMSETAMLADYVLPGTTYFERYDLLTNWITWSSVALRQPVVKPLFGQLPEYEFVAALGRRLGLKDKDGKEYFKVGALSGQPIDDLTAWYEDLLSKELKDGGPAMTLAELKKLPGAVWIDKKGTKYEKYAAPLSDAAIKTAVFDGDPTKDGTAIYDKAKDQGGKTIGVVLGGKALGGFATPTRKVEFESPSYATKKDYNGKAVDTLPVYTPRDWQPDKDYPLYLINWKEASHTHTRTQNNDWLVDIRPMAPLVVHPDTADRFGVKDGEDVWVESPHGKVKAKVKVSERMHPEVVGLQHGFGHWALGKKAKGRGTSDSNLRPTKADPLSGMALHKEACVRIAKV